MVFPKKSCWNIFLVLLGKMIFIFRENIILLFRRKMKDEWKYDIFFKCCEKMIFPKKSHWMIFDLIIFLDVLSGKKIFLFPENMILFFRRTMKDDLSQKNTWKYIFFKCPEKMVFPKKIALEYDISCIIWKYGIFFQKAWYFFFGRKMKDDLSHEIHGNMIFSVYMYKCYKYDIILLQKNQRWYSPEKKHLKVIDILDRILERVPTILCTFIETFIGVFIYCFPVKKNPRKLEILDWNSASSSIYLVRDILQWKNFNTRYHSALRSCI